MTRRFAVLATLLLLAAVPMVATHASESPAQRVRAEVDAVLAVINDVSLSVTARRAKLRSRVASFFDFESISRSILSHHWRTSSERQRRVFVDLVQRVFERFYVAAVESRTTEVIRVGAERHRDDKAIVVVTVLRPRRADVAVVLNLRARGQGWVVYDASVLGLSMVAHFRDRLDGIATREGMTGVLAYFKEKLGES